MCVESILTFQEVKREFSLIKKTLYNCSMFLSSAKLKLTGPVSLEVLTTAVIVLKYFVSLELL